MDELHRFESTPTSNSKDNENDLCCCGCNKNVSKSSHRCARTNLRIMSFCTVDGAVEGFGSSAVCKGCAKKGEKINLYAGSVPRLSI